MPSSQLKVRIQELLDGPHDEFGFDAIGQLLVSRRNEEHRTLWDLAASGIRQWGSPWTERHLGDPMANWLAERVKECLAEPPKVISSVQMERVAKLLSDVFSAAQGLLGLDFEEDLISVTFVGRDEFDDDPSVSIRPMSHKEHASIFVMHHLGTDPEWSVEHTFFGSGLGRQEIGEFLSQWPCFRVPRSYDELFDKLYEGQWPASVRFQAGLRADPLGTIAAYDWYWTAFTAGHQLTRASASRQG